MKLKKEINKLKFDYGVSLAYISRKANVPYRSLYNYYMGYTSSYDYEKTLKVLNSIEEIYIELSLLHD